MYPHEWLIFMVNVGKYYTSPMDSKGPSKMECHIFFRTQEVGCNLQWLRITPQSCEFKVPP